MSTINRHEGVCCECQSVHPVAPDSEYGWLMLPHDHPGTSRVCQGGATVPQAVLGVPLTTICPHGHEDEWEF